MDLIEKKTFADPSKSTLRELNFTGIKFREFCKFWSILWKLVSVKITGKLSICKIRENLIPVKVYMF